MFFFYQYKVGFFSSFVILCVFSLKSYGDLKVKDVCDELKLLKGHEAWRELDENQSYRKLLRSEVISKTKDMGSKTKYGSHCIMSHLIRDLMKHAAAQAWADNQFKVMNQEIETFPEGREKKEKLKALEGVYTGFPRYLETDVPMEAAIHMLRCFHADSSYHLGVLKESSNCMGSTVTSSVVKSKHALHTYDYNFERFLNAIFSGDYDDGLISIEEPYWGDMRLLLTLIYRKLIGEYDKIPEYLLQGSQSEKVRFMLRSFHANEENAHVSRIPKDILNFICDIAISDVLDGKLTSPSLPSNFERVLKSTVIPDIEDIEELKSEWGFEQIHIAPLRVLIHNILTDQLLPFTVTDEYREHLEEFQQKMEDQYGELSLTDC